MRYRRLGGTGLEVSEIGFGAWGIGGNHAGAVSYGNTDDRESERALRRALECGVTFFDTADIYGFGHSERLIGETLGAVRDRVVLATKAGFIGPYGPQDFSPSYLRAALERSLVRLKTDYVDLFQLHNPPMALLASEPAILDTLQRLCAEGKVRAVGVSVKSPEDGLRAVHEFGFKAIQVNFNMIDQRAVECGLLSACERENVGVICRTPLCFGFLSGGYARDARFEPDDHRSRWSSEQIAVWADAHRRFEAARAADETFAQTALRFCLSYPSITTAIPGMLTARHVEENVEASALGRLAPELCRLIERVYQEHEFFVARPPVPAS